MLPDLLLKILQDCGEYNENKLNCHKEHSIFSSFLNFFTPTNGEVWLALSDGGERVVWHPAGCSLIGNKVYNGSASHMKCVIHII